MSDVLSPIEVYRRAAKKSGNDTNVSSIRSDYLIYTNHKGLASDTSNDNLEIGVAVKYLLN